MCLSAGRRQRVSQVVQSPASPTQPHGARRPSSPEVLQAPSGRTRRVRHDAEDIEGWLQCQRAFCQVRKGAYFPVCSFGPFTDIYFVLLSPTKTKSTVLAIKCEMPC